LLIQVIGFFAVTRYRPVWYWDWAQLKPMLIYSFSQAASGWVYSIRNLLPAFLLLPLAGKEAVGYLNVANRFTTMLSFAQEAAGRLSIPAFARVRNDLRRLARAVSEAMQLQTLALGASFACFTLVAPIALPILLGSKWNSQIILITFIILAVRLLLSALFAIQGNALYVRGQNLLMLYANIAYIVLFVGLGYAALLLIPEQYRLYGYVIADLIAHVPTYCLKHWGMVRYIRRPDYRVTVVWTASMIGLLVAPLVSWWLYVPSLALLLLPASRQQLKGLLRELRQHKSSTAGTD
jgi:PST family polysaccharide transporter